MITKTIELYTFEELAPAAQEHVIEKQHDINVDFDDWSRWTLEDWQSKLTAAGFDDPEIYYSGFWSQGDGACFTCKSFDIPKIIRHTKQGKRFAALLYALKQDQVYAEGAIIHTDRYYHKYTMRITDWTLTIQSDMSTKRQDKLESLFDELEGLVLDTARKLAQAIYDSLKKEYEYLTSEEAIKDTILSNEYYFTADGELESA